jgi:glycosyltransferase involved in cell wall biosynthesis
MLREALITLENQTYERLEIVVVEDGNNQAEPVVKKLAERSQKIWRYVAIPKAGRSGAGNLGLALARGEFLGFLDDDDLLFADHVELLTTLLLKHPEANGAYARALEVPTIVSCGERPIYRESGPRHALHKEFRPDLITQFNLFSIQSVLFRRNVVIEHGGFNLALSALEDWDLWVRYFRQSKMVWAEKSTSAFRVPGVREDWEQRQETLLAAYEVVRAMNQIETRELWAAQ